jgi:hypothetical protein
MKTIFEAILKVGALSGMILFVAFLLASILSPGKKAVENYVTSDYDGFYACQNFVEKRLKAPSTADLASMEDSKVRPVKNEGFIVTSYVDAQNSFGVKIRTAYLCMVEYDSTSHYWKLADLEMSDD